MYEIDYFQAKLFDKQWFRFQAYTKHVPHFPGKHWFSKSVSHEFAHHKF